MVGVRRDAAAAFVAHPPRAANEVMIGLGFCFKAV